MKAIVHTKYGSPDVLRLEEVEKPAPKKDEVLVKIHAASTNPYDWHSMRGSPVFVRFISGLLKPKNKFLGVDLAGQVEAVGPNVNRFNVGDEVFGMSRGAFLEYVSTREVNLVLKPPNLSFDEAAAVPTAGLTALQCLRDQGDIQSGQKVLINGASGGVGPFAVQIAKSFGADVTGVCSTRNVDIVRSIGANQVIDYTQEDFTQNGEPYDLILDNVGNRSLSEVKRILDPNGTYILNGYNLALMMRLMLQSRLSGSEGQRMINAALTRTNQSDLEYLRELLEAGEVVPVIDRRYPLSETPEAIRYLEKGHARGKVIITMGQEDNT